MLQAYRVRGTTIIRDYKIIEYYSYHNQSKDHSNIKYI